MVNDPPSSSIILEYTLLPRGRGTARMVGRACHSLGYSLPVGRVTVSQSSTSVLPQLLCAPELRCQVL